MSYRVSISKISFLFVLFSLFTFQSVYAQDSTHVELASRILGGSFETMYFDSENNRLITFGAEKLSIIDISDINEPYEMSYKHSEDDVFQIMTYRHYILLSIGSRSLKVIDISDPYHPVFSGLYNFTMPVDEYYVKDSLLFAFWESDFKIYRLNDTGHDLEFELLDEVESGGPYQTRYFDFDGDLMYLGNYFVGDIFSDNNLFIYDISDPSECSLISRYTLPAGMESWYVEFILNGDFAYLAIEEYLFVYNISDPESLCETGSYHLDVSFQSMGIVDNWLITREFELIDISTPEHPDVSDIRRAEIHEPIDEYSLSFDSGYLVSDSIAIIADEYDNSLYFVDISEITDMYYVAEYNFPKVYDSRAEFGYVYSVCGKAGLYIYDISDPNEPVFVSQYVNETSMTRLAIYGNFLYVKCEDSTLSIINVSDPESPYEECVMEDVPDILDIQTHRNYMYLLFPTELRIINVSEPSAPYEVGSCETTQPVYKLHIVDNKAYIAGDNNHLIQIDISNRRSPNILGVLTFGDGHMRDIYVQGDYAYLPDRHYMRIVDISNPASMFQTWRAVLDGLGSTAVVVCGDYAFIASYDLEIVDVSNPYGSYYKELYETRDGGENIDLCGNHIIFPAYYAGLYIFDVTAYTESIEENVSNVPEIRELAAYPNPFNSAVIFNSSAKIQSGTICDISGRVVKELNENETTWQPSGNIESGVYNIIVNTNNGKETSQVVYIK